MSNNLLNLGLGENYSDFRNEIKALERFELEFLLSAYKMFADDYKLQIKAVADELELRNTPLGMELE